MAYSPRTAPAGIDRSQQPLANYVTQELQSVAQAAGDKVDTILFNVLHKAPSKPRAGMVCVSDGSDWNPGNGAGLYEYTTAWKKVGPPLVGRAVLSGGTVTVNLASVTAASDIFPVCQIPGGTPGFLRISARTAGVSFTILSSSATDTSTVAYQVIEP